MGSADPERKVNGTLSRSSPRRSSSRQDGTANRAGGVQGRNDPTATGPPGEATAPPVPVFRKLSTVLCDSSPRRALSARVGVPRGAASAPVASDVLVQRPDALAEGGEDNRRPASPQPPSHSRPVSTRSVSRGLQDGGRTSPAPAGLGDRRDSMLRQVPASSAWKLSDADLASPAQGSLALTMRRQSNALASTTGDAEVGAAGSDSAAVRNAPMFVRSRSLPSSRKTFTLVQWAEPDENELSPKSEETVNRLTAGHTASSRSKLHAGDAQDREDAEEQRLQALRQKKRTQSIISVSATPSYGLKRPGNISTHPPPQELSDAVVATSAKAAFRRLKSHNGRQTIRTFTDPTDPSAAPEENAPTCTPARPGLRRLKSHSERHTIHVATAEAGTISPSPPAGPPGPGPRLLRSRSAIGVINALSVPTPDSPSAARLHWRAAAAAVSGVGGMDSPQISGMVVSSCIVNMPWGHISQLEALELLHTACSGQVTVQVAECLLRGEQVVVKSYDKHLTSAGEGVTLEQLRREVQLTTALSHECSVRTIGVIEDDVACHLVSCYYPMGDLQQFLAGEDSMSEAEIGCKIIFPVLKALAHFHQAGFAHCDVSAKNIFITDEGDALLGDFNQALPTTAEMTAARMGALAYTAPELISQHLDGQSAPIHPPPVDVWALGVLAYEVTLRMPPFEKSNKSKTLQAILAGELKTSLLGSLSDVCRDFVTSCLQVDPSKRPCTQELLDHPWITQCCADHRAGAGSPCSDASSGGSSLHGDPVWRDVIFVPPFDPLPFPIEVDPPNQDRAKPKAYNFDI